MNRNNNFDDNEYLEVVTLRDGGTQIVQGRLSLKEYKRVPPSKVLNVTKKEFKEFSEKEKVFFDSSIG